MYLHSLDFEFCFQWLLIWMYFLVSQCFIAKIWTWYGFNIPYLSLQHCLKDLFRKCGFNGPQNLENLTLFLMFWAAWCIAWLAFSTAAVEWKGTSVVWIDAMYMTVSSQVWTLKSHYWLLKADCSDSLTRLCPNEGQLLPEVLQGRLHLCWSRSTGKIAWILFCDVSCGWVIRDDLHSVLVVSLVCQVAWV